MTVRVRVPSAAPSVCGRVVKASAFQAEFHEFESRRTLHVDISQLIVTIGSRSSNMSVRKILYSPGYGAGWVSWSGSTRDQKVFMLEYKPFVDFLESGNEFAYRKDIEEMPVVQQFKKDWDAAFPEEAGDYPYFGGLYDLRVMEVPSDARVLITEYDGSESVEVEDEDRGWL